MSRDKEKIKAYNKMKYERDKNQILEQQKIYRENNREVIAEKKKQPHIIAYKKTPIWCECCKIFIQRTSIARHNNSKRHQKNEINLEK